ncbi:MAG: helix-hairpin-helix domain-containing protein [Flavipsychrobacter sp.]|nr:helix-hairpin-helix domain-containing protein [Flavipsychrobacter sp.]
MRKPLRSFTTFNRNEKYGVVALTSLLMILLLVRATMHFFIHPHIDEVQQTRLQQNWQQFQQTHTDTATTQPGYVDNNDDGITPMPAQIDINTADSATLVRLKGIGPVTAHKILEYRSNQHFTNFEELRKLCRMSATNAALLKPHILLK